jgi:hypothetical protein
MPHSLGWACDAVPSPQELAAYRATFDDRFPYTPVGIYGSLIELKLY